MVDTNVLSYALKGDSRADPYLDLLEIRPRCVSFASVAELFRWSIIRKWGKNRLDHLQQHLRGYVVLEYDEPMAWSWARVMSIKGRPIAPTDAWIAAAALRHGLPLVTHNRRHFEGIEGLRLITKNQ
ncbi:MAG TPA: type II toxin-antitoxin system VapC family toxin [Tepidisphaeraceae bacterium]|nr:type II toxin-antitoxin system VapC family toxin [Tepidisphaeraceae bacterium]